MYARTREALSAVVHGSRSCQTPLLSALAARAANICSALTEAEVSIAVGTPLKRSPTGACGFGPGRSSVYLTMHASGASQFETYASQLAFEFSGRNSLILRLRNSVTVFAQHRVLSRFCDGQDQKPIARPEKAV